MGCPITDLIDPGPSDSDDAGNDTSNPDQSRTTDPPTVQFGNPDSVTYGQRTNRAGAVVSCLLRTIWARTGGTPGGTVPVADVCREVWGRERAELPRSTVADAVSRANRVLTLLRVPVAIRWRGDALEVCEVSRPSF